MSPSPCTRSFFHFPSLSQRKGTSTDASRGLGTNGTATAQYLLSTGCPSHFLMFLLSVPHISPRDSGVGRRSRSLTHSQGYSLPAAGCDCQPLLRPRPIDYGRHYGTVMADLKKALRGKGERTRRDGSPTRGYHPHTDLLLTSHHTHSLLTYQLHHTYTVASLALLHRKACDSLPRWSSRVFRPRSSRRPSRFALGRLDWL